MSLGDGELNINFGPIDPEKHATILPTEDEKPMVFGGLAIVAGVTQLQDGIQYPLLMFRFSEPTPNKDGSPKFRTAVLITSQDEMSKLPDLVHQAAHAAIVNAEKMNARNN